MVPDFETPIDVENLPAATWEEVEFWEDIEKKQKKKKLIIITSVLIVGMALMAVSSVLQNNKRWQAKIYARRLSQAIIEMKKQSTLQKVPLEIVFNDLEHLSYKILERKSCKETVVEKKTEARSLGSEENVGSFVLLSIEQGERYQLSGVTNRFCYDPVRGNNLLSQENGQLAFVIVHRDDLVGESLKNVSYVLLKGRSAEISFN